MTQKQNLISVIIPAYNTEQFIKSSVESILNQTYTNLEVIIINDGSTDNTLDVIQSIDDDRIIIISNKENKGVGYCSNLGLIVAKGKYVARQDSDDFSHPTRLEKQHNFLEKNTSVVAIGSNYKRIYLYSNKEEVVKMNNSNYLMTFKYCPIHNPTSMFRKEFTTTHSIKFGSLPEDYPFWNDIFTANNYHPNTFYNLPEVLVEYSIREKQLTDLHKDHIDEHYKKHRWLYIIRLFNTKGYNIKLPSTINIEFGNLATDIWNKIDLPGYTKKQKNEFWSVMIREIIFDLDKKGKIFASFKLYNKCKFWGYKGFLTIIKQKLKI